MQNPVGTGPQIHVNAKARFCTFTRYLSHSLWIKRVPSPASSHSGRSVKKCQIFQSVETQHHVQCRLVEITLHAAAEMRHQVTSVASTLMEGAASPAHRISASTATKPPCAPLADQSTTLCTIDTVRPPNDHITLPTPASPALVQRYKHATAETQHLTRLHRCCHATTRACAPVVVRVANDPPPAC